MTQLERKQNNRMRSVLFYIFIAIFVVIVAGTIGMVFFGLGRPEPHEREILFNVFIGEIGLAVLALFKVLFGLKKPAVENAEVPKVEGTYKYEMSFSETKTKTFYLGECIIKQDQRELAVTGERQKSKNGRKKNNVSIHWNSNWAEVCGDNKIRMDYSINSNGGIRGFAILSANRNSFKEMIGEFHLMHEPYQSGTIKLKRV
jgi:hypothetical protein